MENQHIIELHNNVSYLSSGYFTPEIYQEFRRRLGYRDENYQFAIRSSIERVKQFCLRNNLSFEETQKKIAAVRSWDGYQSLICYNTHHCKCYKKYKGTHFPTGLISLVREFYKEKNIPYIIQDLRERPTISLETLKMSEAFESRDYHLETAENALKKGRGIIKCATGGGKTAIAALILSKLKVSPVIFYVTSKFLLKQAYEEMSKFLINNDIPLLPGMIGDGKRDIRDINIMTVQTAIRALDQKYDKYDDEDEDEDDDINNYKEDIKELIFNAKCVICDEVQHWSAKTCQVISQASENAFYRYGLSATPWRDSNDDILIDSCFGKCFSDISASYLIEKGYLVKPSIYFINMDNMKNCPYNSYQQIYKHALKENDLRNKTIANLANKFYEEGRKVLILCSHIDHGNLLKSIIPKSVFVHGSVNMKERNDHLDVMRGKNPGITIATSIMDEGVDVKPLDTLILAGSGKSSTRALQRIGRIIRPWPDISNNIKKDAIVIDFMDKCKYLLAHSKKRKKIYETEKNFIIKDM